MEQPRRKLKKCCYVQPPVRQSMKPTVKYQRSSTPFNDKTTFRSSYLPIDREIAKKSKSDSMKLKPTQHTIPLDNVDDETMRLLQSDQELRKRSKIPFTDETTTGSDYLPIDQELAKKFKAVSMKPKHEHIMPDIKLDTDTIHNLSYQPIETKRRETPPWAAKKTFSRSKIPMDLNTIYEYSYRLPGKFVECGDDVDKNVIVTYAENCDDIEGLIRIPYKY